jgi:hypothetical protein
VLLAVERGERAEDGLIDGVGVETGASQRARL